MSLNHEGRPLRVRQEGHARARPRKFDQDLSGGWRKLEAKPECTEVAAELLAEYRKAHWGKFKPHELHANFWHEGQLRAAVGRYDRAAVLLAAGVNPGGDVDFLEYALGTIAFLRRDKAGLEAARARLAKMPAPPDFEQMAAEIKKNYGQTITWPPNLDVLDGLSNCFDKPYREAYDLPCRAKPAK